MRGRCLPSSRGPICIAAFKIVSCRTLRWWCGPQAGPNARHHNYSQILRVFPKNLLTIPAVLCDNRIIEQLPNRKNLWQHRTIPALRLKHRSGGCGTASALPKCSIMSGCGTRIVLRGKSPSHSATAAPASVRCFRHWRRSPLQHPVLSALLA